jgi:hypothetical protein
VEQDDDRRFARMATDRIGDAVRFNE